jgi:hypothetical protein
MGKPRTSVCWIAFAVSTDRNNPPSRDLARTTYRDPALLRPTRGA